MRELPALRWPGAGISRFVRRLLSGLALAVDRWREPGPSIMGGGSMMGCRDFAWMPNGAWRHRSRTDWQRLVASWVEAGMMPRADGGWSTSAVVAAVAGALAVGGLAVFAALRRRWRWHNQSEAPGR